MMALARDAHWWALAAAAILEERMEWMSCSISQQCSSSHWCFGSHWCRRSRSSRHRKEDSQATSHHGEPKARVEGPRVTSHHRGTVWGQTQSPSPTRQKCWMTFAEGRVPLPTEESGKWCQSRWSPPVTWQNERAPHYGVNWLRPGGGKGEEDLECPLPLESHLQELLGGVSDPQLALRWKMAWHQCPKTWSPLPCASQLGYSGVPAMWRCQPGGGNFWRFLTMMTVSSLPVRCMPHMRCWRHVIRQRGWIMITPSTGPSIHWKISLYATLRCKVWQSGLLTHPITPDSCLHEGASVLGREGPTTDSWLTSPSGGKCGGTLAGNGASGVLYRGRGFHGHCILQLGGGELTQANGASLWDPHCSHRRSCWAHPRGSLSVASGQDWPTTTEKTDAPAAPPSEKMYCSPTTNPQCPLPRFMEIVCTLQGKESVESSPTSVVGIPPKEAEELYEVMGSSVMVTQLFWHPTSGEMYIDMLTCMLTTVDLGPNPQWVTTQP